MEFSNMFHILLLPPSFTELFPLPSVRFGDLDGETKDGILATLGVKQLDDG